MTEWRSIVTSIGDTAHMHEVHRALSYGDMSLAAYVMGICLTGEDLQKYKCKESLAHDVVVILQGIVQVPLASGWAAHQVKPPAVPAGSPASQPAPRQSIRPAQRGRLRSRTARPSQGRSGVWGSSRWTKTEFD